MKELKATPEVKAAIIEWYERKKELGTQPELAKKWGISVGYVEHIIRAHAKNARICEL